MGLQMNLEYGVHLLKEKKHGLKALGVGMPNMDFLVLEMKAPVSDYSEKVCKNRSMQNILLLLCGWRL